ncbi:MAG: hypothetical protein DSY83_16240 [Flavobacteriia bacterium]|nr:MAG: hypothetical protein DSY83_16240 [Flavobacteriia bacterium]
MSVQLRSRTLKSGAKSLYLDIHHNGERWREFLKIKILPKDPSKIEKKRIAERIRANRELEVLSEETGHIPQHLKKINFFVFAENYIQNYKNKDVRIIASSVEKFKESVNNPRLAISAISPKTMTLFKDYLIYDAGLAGETAHNYFTRFKKVLKAAKVQGYLNEMPTTDIRFSNPNKDDTLKKQVLDSDELQKLANTICGNGDVKKAFLFACYTSLGLAEIRKLKWKNINKGRLITNRNKTGELINNRLNQTALDILGKPGIKDDFIFNIQSLSDNGANKAIRYWVNRAEIDDTIPISV